MSQLEPTTQAFIDGLAGATPIYTLSPEAARNVLAGAQKSVSVKLAPARSEDRVLNGHPDPSAGERQRVIARGPRLHAAQPYREHAPRCLVPVGQASEHLREVFAD